MPDAGSSNYSSGSWMAWNRTVLDYLKDHADYIALHYYARNNDDNYYKFMAFAGFAEKAFVYEVNGKNIKDENSFQKQLVKTKTKETQVKGKEFTYTFPAHSYTMIRIPVSGR